MSKAIIEMKISKKEKRSRKGESQKKRLKKNHYKLNDKKEEKFG